MATEQDHQIARLHNHVGWIALVRDLLDEIDTLNERMTVAGVDSWDEYQRMLGQIRSLTLVIKRVQDAHEAVMEDNR